MRSMVSVTSCSGREAGLRCCSKSFSGRKSLDAIDIWDRVRIRPIFLTSQFGTRMKRSSCRRYGRNFNACAANSPCLIQLIAPTGVQSACIGFEAPPPKPAPFKNHPLLRCPLSTKWRPSEQSTTPRDILRQIACQESRSARGADNTFELRLKNPLELQWTLS